MPTARRARRASRACRAGRSTWTTTTTACGCGRAVGGDGGGRHLHDHGDQSGDVAREGSGAGGLVQSYPAAGYHEEVFTSGAALTGNDFGNVRKQIVITPDKANCSQPYVHIVNQDTGELRRSFLAYEESFRGGVRVATGDVTGDGIPEIITAPGRNHIPLIRVFDINGTMLTEFLAFGSSFLGGVDVAVGDVTGDGLNDIAASMTYNGSQVVVFQNRKTRKTRTTICPSSSTTRSSTRLANLSPAAPRSNWLTWEPTTMDRSSPMVTQTLSWSMRPG